jgi:sugar/nucleoside kinase (ribokinase family)
MPINRLGAIRASNNKSLSLLLFFRAAGINAIIIKEGEDKSNISSGNKGRNVLLYLGIDSP